MDKLSESRFSMQLGSTNFLKTNSTIFSPLPGYPALLTRLDSNNNTIIQAGQLQGANRTGLAETKNVYRTNLVSITFKVANHIEVYAKANGNLELANEVHVPETHLMKYADTKLNEHALRVQTRVLEFLTELTPYGVNGDMTDELEAAISAFFDSIHKPADAIALSKQATKRLKELLKENDEILAKIDNLSEIIRFTNADVYNRYHTLRNVVETGKRYIALKAKATDASTGLPLSDVLFRFGPQDGTIYPVGVPVPETYTKKTADKGSFMIKNMVPGSYQVTVSFNGYQPQNQTVYINEGNMATLNVALVPLNS